jgi:predicted nucleic acid-binding protein
VTRPSRKYVLDTQLFIQAFLDRGANEALQEFQRVFAPFEYFSVIVAQELRAGIQRPQDRKALEKNVLRVFERPNRTITPSADAWHRSGDRLAEMARQEGLEIARVSKAFANTEVEEPWGEVLRIQECAPNAGGEAGLEHQRCILRAAHQGFLGCPFDDPHTSLAITLSTRERSF